MSAKPPFRALPMDDEDMVAVIRYDGDPDTFAAVAWAFCIKNDLDFSVEPPDPRLYRVNPDHTGEYAWLLAEADKPGRGVFLGAKVKTGTYFEPAWIRGISR